MKKWKKILLGVLGAGLITWGAVEAATLRNKPASKTKTEAMWDALDDILETDGTWDNVLTFTAANTHTGLEVFDRFVFGTETVTLSSANPGIGTASASVSYHAIVSDDTGAATDTCSVLDGTVAGQYKIFSLKTDGETTGMALTPVSFGGGTDILFEDVGDGCVLVWDGSNWQLVSNNGGTVR